MGGPSQSQCSRSQFELDTMPRYKTLLLIPLVILLSVGGLFFVGLQDGQDDGGLASAWLHQKAPEFNPQPFGEEETPNQTDLQQPTIKLVNFWASWCAPCRVEHPHLETLKDQGHIILGINYKDKAEQAHEFLGELGNPYHKIGGDPTGRTAIHWGVYGIPETFVIDSQGVIRLRWAGPITSRILEERIYPVLQEFAVTQ